LAINSCIKELDFSGCFKNNLNEDKIKSISNLIENSKFLKILSFQECALGSIDDGLKIFFDAFKYNQNIEELNLNKNYFLENENSNLNGITLLSEFIANSKFIKKIHLERIYSSNLNSRVRELKKLLILSQ